MRGFLLKPHSTSQSSGPSCSKGGYKLLKNPSDKSLSTGLHIIGFHNTDSPDSDLYFG